MIWACLPLLRLSQCQQSVKKVPMKPKPWRISREFDCNCFDHKALQERIIRDFSSSHSFTIIIIVWFLFYPSEICFYIYFNQWSSYTVREESKCNHSKGKWRKELVCHMCLSWSWSWWFIKWLIKEQCWESLCFYSRSWWWRRCDDKRWEIASLLTRDFQFACLDVVFVVSSCSRYCCCCLKLHCCCVCLCDAKINDESVSSFSWHFASYICCWRRSSRADHCNHGLGFSLIITWEQKLQEHKKTTTW